MSEMTCFVLGGRKTITESISRIYFLRLLTVMVGHHGLHLPR